MAGGKSREQGNQGASNLEWSSLRSSEHMLSARAGARSVIWPYGCLVRKTEERERVLTPLGRMQVLDTANRSQDRDKQHRGRVLNAWHDWMRRKRRYTPYSCSVHPPASMIVVKCDMGCWGSAARVLPETLNNFFELHL